MKTVYLVVLALCLAAGTMACTQVAWAQNDTQTAPPPSDNPPAAAPANTAPAPSSPAAANPSTPPSNAVELPSGTEIAVRANETINSDEASEGQTYSAEVLDNVSDASGNVVIPKGADAQLIIRNSSNGGTVGSAQLALDLQSVTVNGHRYLVSTQDISQTSNQGIGKNKRTGEMVGGGAVLGTLLGAIAGGGKGAAIGAIAGATAGGATQVLTRGKQVKVPAETVLRFQLDKPLHLNPVS